MAKTKKRSPYALESEMCAAFTARARAAGWLVHPEVDNWDLVLVWPLLSPLPSVAPRHRFSELLRRDLPPFKNIVASTFKPGMQIGIQAKLRPNVEVLSQAVRYPLSAGPHFRALLVPYVTEEFRDLAAHMGLVVYVEDKVEKTIRLPSLLWETKARLVLPPIEASWDGGGRSPKSLGPWRVGALKICSILRSKGVVTKADLAAVGHRVGSWVQQGWLVSERTPAGWVYRPTSLDKLPDRGYEAERDKIAALTPIR
jgi:hypothetical protein